MTGVATIGTMPLGTVFVKGRRRVPKPAAGITAFRILCNVFPPRPPLPVYAFGVQVSSAPTIDVAMRERRGGPDGGRDRSARLHTRPERPVPAIRAPGARHPARPDSSFPHAHGTWSARRAPES